MSRPKKSSCSFPPYEDISNWDVRRMLQWLRKNGLHSSIDTFAEEKINGDLLLSMSENDLNSKRRITDKDKKKLVKALARLPNSQITRQPGIMTMIRGQLKKKIGRDDVGVPPPVPQADYYTVMDHEGTGGNGWDSDEFESSDEYEDPPDEESFEIQRDTNAQEKFHSLRQQFQAAGFSVPARPWEKRGNDQDDEIYDAPEPDHPYPHTQHSLDEEMYVPPQTMDDIQGGIEVYEVPDIEAGVVERRPPPRIPGPRVGGPQFSSRPMSPTEPPPDDEFSYGDQDELYDIPPEDVPEVKTPPPPVIKKPVLPAQFGARPLHGGQQQPNRMPPCKPNLKDRLQKPVPPRQPQSSSSKSPLSTEPALPDRSSKPTHIMHTRLPPGKKPPLPSKEDLPSDDEDSKAVPNKPSLPNSHPVLPTAAGRVNMKETQPPIPSREFKPAMPSREFKPAMPSRETKPPMPDRESKPSLPARDTKPAMPAKDSKPGLPDRSHVPSSRENKPLPELSSRPRMLPASPKPKPQPQPQPHLPVRSNLPNVQDKLAAVLQLDTRFHSSEGEEHPSKESPAIMKQLKPPLSPRLVQRKSSPPADRPPPLPSSAKPAVLLPGPAPPLISKPQMRPFPASKPKKLEEFDWFHGDTDRRTCEVALKRYCQDGSFMVRNSKNYPGEYSISLFYKEDIKHLRIRRRPDGKFAVGEEKSVEKAFTNIIDLVEHHRKEPLSLKTGGLAKLTHGCPL